LLIIFDLDDTLIDTSGGISPFQIRRTFFKLLEHGLEVDDPNEELKKILYLQNQTKKSIQVLESFLDSVSATKYFYELVNGEMATLLPDSFEVRCYKGVKEILESLSKKVPICLVTRGQEVYQRQKIQKAGIDSAIFSKIIVTREKNKKIHYKKLMSSFDTSRLIVCGDHIDVDLVPAKELGGITICVEESNRPLDETLLKFLDYRVKHFFQVESIIEKLIGIGT